MPNSGRPTPTSSAADAHNPVTSGTSTRCSFGSTVGNIICGARSTTTATFLDVLVQVRRNAFAAKNLFRKILKGMHYAPRVIVTDRLGRCSVAHRQMLASVEHRRSKYVNNRAENPHQPTRQRERAMKRLTSPGHAQRFLSAFSDISPHFRPTRHRLSAPEWRTEMADRFALWQKSPRPTPPPEGERPGGFPATTCPKPAAPLNFSINVTVPSHFPHFRPPRHRMNPTDRRTEIRARFQVWNQDTGLRLTV